ncbi:helix-turn-helix domain-containing protein [Streptomyces sp. NPDC001661]
MTNPLPPSQHPSGAGISEAPSRIAALATSWLDDVDVLATRLLERVEVLPAYQQVRVPPEAVRESATATLRLLIRLLAGEPVEAQLHALCAEVGEDRARRHIPLGDLLQAVRLDFELLWGALQERADEGDLGELMRSGQRVWEVAEMHTLAVLDAYLRTTRDMDQEREDLRQAAFVRLLDSAGGDGDVVAEAAAILRMDPDGTFCAVAAPPGNVRALAAATTHLHSRGLPIHHHLASTGDLLLVQLPGDRTRLPLEWLSGVPCAVGPTVRGLAAAAEAARLAVLAMRALPVRAVGPAYLDSMWPQVLLAQHADLRHHLVNDVLGALVSVGVEERDRLLEAVRAQLDGTGSVNDTAARLFCHRNTVVNRLRRFAELTGFDTRRPREATVIVLALDALATGTPTPWASAH